MYSSLFKNFCLLRTKSISNFDKRNILLLLFLYCFGTLNAQTLNNGKVHGNPIVYVTASKSGRYHSIPNCQGLRFAKSKIIAVRYSDVCKSRKPCKLCCKSLSTNATDKKDSTSQKRKVPMPKTVPNPGDPDVFDSPVPYMPF